MTRADATDAAWEATAAAFTPLPDLGEPDATPITETPDGEGADGEAAGAEWDPGDDGDDTPGLGTTETPADLIRDIIWVNENLGRRGLAPKHAPSRSAWNILEYARKYQKPFVENLLVKALTLNAKEPDESATLRREEMKIAEIRRIIGDFNRQWEEELLADVPGTVREGVRSRVDGWAQRCRLDLPADTRASLEAEIATLVQECVNAISRPSGDS